MLAALRADLHNTSSRQFERHMEPADFMPGQQDHIEQRVAELMATGRYTPSQAVAIVTSRQSKEHKLYVIDQSLKDGPRKAKPKRMA